MDGTLASFPSEKPPPEDESLFLVSASASVTAAGCTSRVLLWRAPGGVPVRQLTPFSTVAPASNSALATPFLFRCVSWDRYVAAAPSASSGSASVLSLLTLERDTPVARSTTADTVTALRPSHDGRYVAAGTAGGRCYVWDWSSGMMLSPAASTAEGSHASGWPAHLRAVRDLVFTDDDDMLISGGEDGSLAFWYVHQLFTLAAGDGTAVSPSHRGVVQPHRRIYNAHTLPVVALSVGCGGARARLCSIGQDRVLKIWTVADAQLLATVTLPHVPSCVEMDRHLERHVYVGLENGAVVRIDLRSTYGGAAPSSDWGQATDATSPSADSHRFFGLNGGASVPGASLPSRVNALCLAKGGRWLLCGFDDGTVAVVDSGAGARLDEFRGPQAHRGEPILHIGSLEAWTGAGGISMALPLHASAYVQERRRQLRLPSQTRLPPAAVPFGKTAPADRLDYALVDRVGVSWPPLPLTATNDGDRCSRQVGSSLDESSIGSAPHHGALGAALDEASTFLHRLVELASASQADTTATSK